MTSLKELKALGGYIPDQLVKKEIKWRVEKDSDELAAMIHVKRMSVGDYEETFIEDADKRSGTARLISRAIRLGEGGREEISYKDAYRLHPRLAEAMCKAFNEVNASKKT